MDNKISTVTSLPTLDSLDLSWDTITTGTYNQQPFMSLTTDSYSISLGSNTITNTGTNSLGSYTITNTGTNTGNLFPEWNQWNYNIPYIQSPDYGINTSAVNTGIKINGECEVDGDLKVKGKSIVDSLEKIEEKLAILYPNEKLEEKWDKLRELRRQYMELEKDIIEKEKIWETLKK